MSDSVHFRNARALSEAAKADRVRHDGLLARVTMLEAQLARLLARVDSLEQGQRVVQARLMGHGPTVRSE